MNSPLGALQSGTDSTERAAEKLRGLLPASLLDDRKTARVLSALESAASTSGQAGRRVGAVVQRLKGFVRLDEADLALVDIGRCIEDAVAVVERDESRVRLHTELCPGAEVRGNPASLSQAFATLIENAVEAIEGEGSVTASCQVLDDTVIVEVVDTGRGMTAEIVARLFDVDFTAGERVRARFGLPVCHSIVSGHGGSIAVESEPESGTRVRVSLPLASTDG